jgi:hypothetical protein
MPKGVLKHGGLRVYITGGRDYDERETVFRALDKVMRKHGVVCLISGHCTDWDGNPRGADRWGEEWADARGVPKMLFEVTRQEWKTIGRRAGPIRNERAIVKGCPDLCVHFPGGTGTADALARCYEHGVLRWNPLTNEVT